MKSFLTPKLLMALQEPTAAFRKVAFKKSPLKNKPYMKSLMPPITLEHATILRSSSIRFNDKIAFAYKRIRASSSADSIALYWT